MKQPKQYKELLKKEENKEVEECMLCRRDIFIKKDDFVQVIDFKSGTFYTDGFYHTNCYLERINKTSKTTELQTKTEMLLNMATKLMGGDDKPMEEYYINKK